MFIAIICFTIQGLANLIFACTDFHAHKMALHAHSCMQKYIHMHKEVTVGANLHYLIYNVLNDFVPPICFGSTQKV